LFLRFLFGLKIKIYKNIILPVALYGCGVWSHTVREQIEVSENGIMMRIFGPKREDVTGGWRRLHYEELHKLYASLNIIRVIKSRRMKSSAHVARPGDVTDE
jgi:hypothetical protein